MNGNNIVIHIGFHKSASTYLQQCVFPTLPVNYVYFSGNHREMLDMIESETCPDPAVIHDWLRQEIGRGNRKLFNTTVISHEELSGHPHGRESINRFTTAKNLRHVFPRAKILIVIRNQLDYLTSIYTFRVAVKGHEHRSLEQFISQEKGLINHLKYDTVVDYYTKLFGRQRVRVLFLENLKAGRDDFINNICRFLEVPSVKPAAAAGPINESTKYAIVLGFWRCINYLSRLLVPKRYQHLYYSAKKRLTTILNKIFRHTKEIDIKRLRSYSYLSAIYGPSNARLEQLLNADLSRLNYPVDKNTAP